MPTPPPPAACDLMTTPIISVAMTMPLRDAASLLTDQRISGALVIDHAKRPQGAVSLTDIAAYLAGLEAPANEPQPRRGSKDSATNSPGWDEGGGDPEGALRVEATVAEVMTSGIVTVKPDDSMTVVARVMVDHGIHRVFVADERGPIGLISTMDLARGVAGRPARRLPRKAASPKR